MSWFHVTSPRLHLHVCMWTDYRMHCGANTFLYFLTLLFWVLLVETFTVCDLWVKCAHSHSMHTSLLVSTSVCFGFAPTSLQNKFMTMYFKSKGSKCHLGTYWWPLTQWQPRQVPAPLWPSRVKGLDDEWTKVRENWSHLAGHLKTQRAHSQAYSSTMENTTGS